MVFAGEQMMHGNGHHSGAVSQQWRRRVVAEWQSVIVVVLITVLNLPYQ